MVAHTYISLPPIIDIWFQVLFHSPSGVLFTFPSRYSFTIGHRVVFSLGRWSSQIPTGFHVSRGTRDPAKVLRAFAYRAITFYDQAFQPVLLALCIPYRGPTTPKGKPSGLGCSHFARRYSGNRFCFLFLRILRCFNSPGSPL